MKDMIKIDVTRKTIDSYSLSRETDEGSVCWILLGNTIIIRSLSRLVDFNVIFYIMSKIRFHFMCCVLVSNYTRSLSGLSIKVLVERIQNKTY